MGFNGVISTIAGYGPEYAYVQGSYITINDLPQWGAPFSFEFHMRVMHSDAYHWIIFWSANTQGTDYFYLDTTFITGEVDFQAAFDEQSIATSFSVLLTGNATNPIVTGNWQHVVVTMDATGLASVYIDCQLLGSKRETTGSGTVISPNEARVTNFGGNSGNSPDYSTCPTDVDFFNFYDNYVLTQTDVTSLCHPTATSIPPVDCVVTEWSSWSTCDANCGAGSQTRDRSIRFPSTTGGASCPLLTDSQACVGLPICGPNDCEVSNWSAWGSCSSGCNGVQSRTRSVTQPMKPGGLACPALTQSQSCNQDCSASTGGGGGSSSGSPSSSQRFAVLVLLLVVFAVILIN